MVSFTDDSRGIVYDHNIFYNAATVKCLSEWDLYTASLLGESLKVVWGEFSASSWVVLFQSNITSGHAH